MKKETPASPFPCKSRLGRLDLLLALHQGGDKRLQYVAEQLGYQWSPTAPKQTRATTAPNTTEQTPAASQTAPPVPITPPLEIGLWLLKQKSQKPDQPIADEVHRLIANAAVITAEELEQHQPQAEPPPEPLVNPNHSELLLHQLTHTARDGKRIDSERLVERVAQLEPILPLPFLKRMRAAPFYQIIIDVSHHLSPYRRDFLSLKDQLRRYLGQDQIDIWLLTQIQPPAFYHIDSQTAPVAQAYLPPPGGSLVLALTDLGDLAPSPKSARLFWLLFGRRLQQCDCEAVAALPQGESFWSSRHQDVWTRFPLSMPANKDGQGHQPITAIQEQQLHKLLCMLSPLTAASSALLRALRLLLPGVDPGLEARVWGAEQVIADYEDVRIRPEYLDQYRRDFQDQNILPAPLRTAVLNQAAAFRHGATQEMLNSETLIAKTLLGEAQIGDAAFWARIIKTLQEGDDQSLKKALALWLERSPAYMHAKMWQQHDLLSKAFVKQRRLFHPTTEQEYPAGLDITRFTALQPQTTTLKSWLLYQHGRELTFVPHGSTDSGDLAGHAPLARIQTRLAKVAVTTSPRGGSRWRHLSQDEITRHRLSAGGYLRVESELDRLELQLAQKPAWATAVGRDAHGVFAEIATETASRRLYWWPKHRLLVNETASFQLQHGAWLDANAYETLAAYRFPRPSWAQAIGVDRYGIYADMVIAGIVQRFRWIAPGEFMMGASEDEDGNEREYPQHQVLITRPFWLADTACAQALWKAVTGENPSHFKGDDLPVERVSWKNIQAFLEKVNQTDGDLALRLPTEAEWEYACRAGTRTPFSFGANITPDQVNYNGNHPYKDGAKGISREKTISVKKLPQNPWGLYQMHGNVYEWCSDWFSSYSKVTTVDPVGPSEGRFRVMRGGCWSSRAGWCRSAGRSRRSPDFAWDDTGFRLARGQ